MFKIKTEVAEQFKIEISDQKFKDVMEVIKAQGEDRSFKVIASTSDIDRDSEIIDQNGWDLKNYLNNPVILWAHNSRELPIGMATKVYLEGGQLIVEGKFAPASANPFAEQVYQLYKEGFIKTVSVGFMGLEFETARINNKDVWIWKKTELLELSFVPVPANPEALTLLSAKGFDKKLMKDNSEKTVEERLERLEKVSVKIADKVEAVEKSLNARITRKFIEISQRIHSKQKADSPSDEKDEGEGEKSLNGRTNDSDDATLAYLADNKSLLQDMAKFASEALRDIKKVKN